ncbi:MAG: TauD/TfdA family dioxygenase [Burkholderiales bacterium]|nr:TauD/TfdA family dioxygenase [Burkholderiales bacterium]
MQVVPFDSVIGAEIRGIAIDQGVTPAQYGAVRAALDRHSVVVLRGQTVTPERQKAFAQGIGTLRPLVYSRYSLPGSPEVMVVSNIRRDGEFIGIPDAGSLWHSDGAYLAHPDMYSLLYGIEIPERDGQVLGDTLFTSVWKAHDALPPEVRERIRGRYCVNSFAWHLEKKAALGDLRRAPLTPEQKAATPDVTHPVVRRHPHTGVPCLFVSEAHSVEIVGMPRAESDALLAQLLAHLKAPRFQYRHRWRPGDLVIWDNCAVQHLATFDYGEIPRRMHRTGSFGPAPVPY